MIKILLKDRFDFMVAVVFASLILLIMGTWLLSNFQEPHIRFFEVSGKVESADVTNQRVKIFFSSPMDKNNTQEYVQIEPAIKFRAAWSNNNLFIIFEQNLSADSDYLITFKNEFKDLYSKSLASSQKIKFRTKPQYFLYVQSFENSKSLVKSDLKLNTEEIFKDGTLKSFDAGGNYATVITQNANRTNDVKVINLETKQIDSLFINDKLILDIAFSPTRNEFAYIKQSVSVKPEYVMPLEETSIVIFNIDTKEQKVIDFTAPGEGVSNIKFSPDGNSILYKTSQSYYNLIDISAPDTVIQLGRYLGDGGFNFDGSQLTFVEFDPLQTFAKSQYIVELNFERESNRLTNGDNPVLDPEYFNNSEGIIYAEMFKEINNTKGQYRIVKGIEDGKTVVIQDDVRSLELPKLSFDDRYILIEGYRETDLLNYQNVRVFDFQTKPETSDLLIYDIKEQRLVDLQTRGYDALWLR